MAKNSDKKAGKKGRKASAKDDRKLLELGEDLLTAVRLHRAVQEHEVRAALASAHADLEMAAGDLVARIASRFLEEAGVATDRRDRYVRWAEDAAAPAADEVDPTVPGDSGSQSH